MRRLLGKMDPPIFLSFECFSGMLLSTKPFWSNCEECLLYLQGKNVQIDDAKLFAQFIIYNFVEIKVADEGFGSLLAHEKWAKYFQSFSCPDVFSQRLKVPQFCLV